MNDGFIDLRQNQGGLLEESFWPSFTDIMTVVVMIFLIATTILIVNNWELVAELQDSIEVEKNISQRLKESIAAQQETTSALQESLSQREQIKQKLQASIEAEQRTAEAVKTSTAINATLEEQLDDAQSQISMLRLQLMQAGESASERDRLIIDQQQEITLLTGEKRRLDRALASGKSEIAALTEQISQSGKSIQSLKSELALKATALENKQNELQLKQVALSNIQNELQQSAGYVNKQKEQMLIMNQQNELQQKSIENFREQISATRQEHSILVGDYKKLEDKYNKLIRPSRSAIGKYVVEVKYEKRAGVEKILLKKSADEGYRQVSESELHKQLKRLKETYKDKLYVKIIIPDDSGLSYSEAWAFMSGMLDKYDYYYQN